MVSCIFIQIKHGILTSGDKSCVFNLNILPLMLTNILMPLFSYL